MADDDRYHRLRRLVAKRLTATSRLDSALLAGVTGLVAEAADLYETGQLDLAEQMLHWALRLCS